MKRGPKPKPPALKVISGTDQPVRRRERVVVLLPGEPRKPAWLKGRASELWDIKVATYAARDQNIVGCESALAEFCQLESSLIDMWLKGRTPPVGAIMAFKSFAVEFYDTPASQVGPIKASAASSFAANVRKPQGGSHA